MKTNAWWMLLLAVLTLSLAVACAEEDDDDDNSTTGDTGGDTGATGDTGTTGDTGGDTGATGDSEELHKDVDCDAALDATGDICSQTIGCACTDFQCSSVLWGDDDPALIEFGCYPPCQDVEGEECAHVSDHHVCVAYDEEGTIAACHGSGNASGDAVEAKIWILAEGDQLETTDIVENPNITVSLNGEEKAMQYSYGFREEIEGVNYIYLMLEGVEGNNTLWRVNVSFPESAWSDGGQIPVATAENENGYGAYLQKMSFFGSKIVAMSVMGISSVEASPITVTTAGGPCTFPDPDCATASLALDIDFLEAKVVVDVDALE